jgi:hypothetical protein
MHWENLISDTNVRKRKNRLALFPARPTQTQSTAYQVVDGTYVTGKYCIDLAALGCGVWVQMVLALRVSGVCGAPKACIMQRH